MDRELYEEIELPDELTQQAGLEILRAGIVDGDLQIVLKRCFDEPDAWGAAAAQILHYAADIYGKESDISFEDALGRMVDTFMKMIMTPVEGSVAVPLREN
jgi:hypothetical protein